MNERAIAKIKERIASVEADIDGPLISESDLLWDSYAGGVRAALKYLEENPMTDRELVLELCKRLKLKEVLATPENSWHPEIGPGEFLASEEGSAPCMFIVIGSGDGDEGGAAEIHFDEAGKLDFEDSSHAHFVFGKR